MESRHEHATLIPAEHVNTGLSQIGVVVYDDGLFRDALLARCAAGLVASGYRLGGVVQSNAHRRGRRRCDMYAKDLLGGDEIKISLDRGNEARGCRLDPDAFARIDAWVERAVLQRVDLLIINKFGREEAHGRGLRPVIAEALIAEIPLVIGVSTQNLCDFVTLVRDSATRLGPTSRQLRPGVGTRLSVGLTIDSSRGCHPCKHRGGRNGRSRETRRYRHLRRPGSTEPKLDFGLEPRE
jgi:nucleoside-triphosphatase THEP1